MPRNQLASYALTMVAAVAVACVLLRKRVRHLRPFARARTLSLDDFARTAAAGDLVLYSGDGACGRAAAVLSKLLEDSPYTHVGVVYVDPDTRVPYVWEMRAESESGREHTRLSNLRRNVAAYPGQVCVRRLLRDGGGPSVDERRFRTVVRRLWGKRYSYPSMYYHSLARLFCFGVPAVPRAGRDAGRYCTDLVAQTYEALGVLDYAGHSHGSSSALPCDFGQHTEVLPLRPGYRFDDEALVVASVTPSRAASTIAPPSRASRGCCARGCTARGSRGCARPAPAGGGAG